MAPVPGHTAMTFDPQCIHHPNNAAPHPRPPAPGGFPGPTCGCVPQPHTGPAVRKTADGEGRGRPVQVSSSPKCLSPLLLSAPKSSPKLARLPWVGRWVGVQWGWGWAVSCPRARPSPTAPSNTPFLAWGCPWLQRLQYRSQNRDLRPGCLPSASWEPGPGSLACAQSPAPRKL